MDKDKPYLTLVDPDRSTEQDDEFLPLPHYPWDERPPTVALDVDECATALHLAQGDLPAAAALLKVPLHKLNRQVLAHPRLARILSEANALVIARAASEYIRALDASSDRRREWAAKNLLATRAAQAHPFAPAPPSSSATLSLTDAGSARTLTFRWRTDADEVPVIDADV
jgi:hypothetical protein